MRAYRSTPHPASRLSALPSTPPGSNCHRMTPVFSYSLKTQHHSLALLADGTVRAWGDNTFGQLADGGVGTSISGLSGIVAIDQVYRSRGQLRVVDLDALSSGTACSIRCRRFTTSRSGSCELGHAGAGSTSSRNGLSRRTTARNAPIRQRTTPRLPD